MLSWGHVSLFIFQTFCFSKKIPNLGKLLKKKLKSERKGNNRLIVSFLFTFQKFTKSYKSTCVQIFAKPIHHFCHFSPILPLADISARRSRELRRKGCFHFSSSFSFFRNARLSKSFWPLLSSVPEVKASFQFSLFWASLARPALP